MSRLVSQVRTQLCAPGNELLVRLEELLQTALDNPARGALAVAALNLILVLASYDVTVPTRLAVRRAEQKKKGKKEEKRKNRLRS